MFSTIATIQVLKLKGMCRIHHWIVIPIFFLTGIVLFNFNGLLDFRNHYTLHKLKNPEPQTKGQHITVQYLLPNVSDSAESHITQWHQAPWEPVDNERIFMHHATENDPDAKQSCVAESVAKHNPTRQVQIFMRIPSNWSKEDYITNHSFNSSWWRVVNHYSNLQIVLYNEETYFNNTDLAKWYQNRAWKQSLNEKAHLADYSTVTSLFRGGGLFLDFDSAVALKSFRSSKFCNFFVMNSTWAISHVNQITPAVVIPDIMHLVFKHYLGEEIIWQLSKADYNPFANPRESLAVAVSASLSYICSDEIGSNQCLDVQLLEERHVFLPPFISPFWLPTLEALKQAKSSKTHQESTLSKLIVSKAIDLHEGSLIRWSAMDYAKRQQDSSLYSTLYSTILSKSCPLTVAHFPCVLFEC